MLMSMKSAMTSRFAPFRLSTFALKSKNWCRRNRESPVRQYCLCLYPPRRCRRPWRLSGCRRRHAPEHVLAAESRSVSSKSPAGQSLIGMCRYNHGGVGLAAQHDIALAGIVKSPPGSAQSVDDEVGKTVEIDVARRGDRNPLTSNSSIPSRRKPLVPSRVERSSAGVNDQSALPNTT